MLPNNRCVALGTLKATERRLARNPDHANLYSRQIEDMISRGAARAVEESELEIYNGPKFYLCHHAIYKAHSKSTPCRIVFNSSAKFQGYSLNDYLAKGPSLLNQLLGILIRFRENKVAFIGDISKMFHSIDIPNYDQMTHLFLWRNFEIDRSPKTYAMTAVNMGDRPSATIAQVALRKTAEEAAEEFPVASKVIKKNSYMDDIPASVNTDQDALKCMKDIEILLGRKGFHIKEWLWKGMTRDKEKVNEDQKTVQMLLNSSENDKYTETVLGMSWNILKDEIVFTVGKLSSSDTITKRQILYTVNTIFDPLGLLSPFTVKPKILLRKIWAMSPSINWDDKLPYDIEEEWREILSELKTIDMIRFKRSLTPEDAVGLPTLIDFSDGSSQAYGAVAYCRWKTSSGYKCRLIMAKSRIAPLKIIDIVRLELCGAVINKRIRTYIQKEMEIEFQKVYHIVDSEIVKAMINRDSYGFNTFAANRIGEIHQDTMKEEWYWLSGKLNIADILTRGSSTEKIDENSIWQRGPKFLELDEAEWPVRSLTSVIDIPELKPISAFVGVTDSEDTLAWRININRFSKWSTLIHTTARILKLYKRFKTFGDRNQTSILPEDLYCAENFWIKEAQRKLHNHLNEKQYLKLIPQHENGIIHVGGRTERWMGATWNKQRFVLLPKDDTVSKLIITHEHEKIGHLGIASTVAHIRSKYWIIGISRTARSIISRCVKCKRKLKRVASQVMSPLPTERIKPSPAFFNIGIDYFGPFIIKGEVQQRTRGKCYGVLFTCFCSWVVHVEVASDYSTDGFLQVMRRYSSIRGWPHTIFSDKGTQLVGASNELKEVVANLNWENIKSYGHKKGTMWSFAPADAPWFNGATEALVKTVKRALTGAIGEQVLTFSELQTCIFEAAQLVNQRPIGAHPSDPNEGSYLCPNDLILGRASPEVPQGPFKERTSNRYRFDFLQQIVDAFWKSWSRRVFPSLVIQPKWHTKSRNIQNGDVVMVENSNSIRGKWKLAVVKEAMTSKNGRVRRAILEYKSESGTVIVVERPVQKLVVLVPATK